VRCSNRASRSLAMARRPTTAKPAAAPPPAPRNSSDARTAFDNLFKKAELRPAPLQLAELYQAPRLRMITCLKSPAPGPGEIQVRVTAVGICGSDVHNFSEGGVGDTACV